METPISKSRLELLEDEVISIQYNFKELKPDINEKFEKLLSLLQPNVDSTPGDAKEKTIPSSSLQEEVDHKSSKRDRQSISSFFSLQLSQ